ncbi:DUF4232 domain-containing protein [Symbioplanes lichenis]|uniref:DUF4232 domain-containing protein n=1 Tax=Symbioplanes lichenis TaxID=1629072 RepID=UPI0027388705|nr:DUF4232 domain-containing protein [Actinoplanes lichenis]
MRRWLIGTAVVLLAAGCAPAGVSPATGLRSSWPVPPSPSPTCPPGGARIEAGSGDAAMGLRVLDFTLTNCGTTAYQVEGYPTLTLLDEEHKPQDVRVLHDIREITISVPNLEVKPRLVTLQPGQRATAGVVWRNTYDDISHPPVNAFFLEMAPQPGRPEQTVVPDSRLDLGSTGRIGVSPWVFDPESPERPAPRQEPPPASEDPSILAIGEAAR